jgi:hypothetical protein
MAVGTVSSVSDDAYQLIATNTTTSGATTTFSGLGAYKKLILAWEGVSMSGGPMLMTFNSSTSSYYGRWYSIVAGVLQIAANGIPLNYNSLNTSIAGYIVIENTSNNAPKIIRGNTTDTNPRDAEIQGSWFTADTITTLTVTSAGTFSAGTFKLYGIAA